MSEPFSRPIRVEAIPHEGLETRIEADEQERAALAAFNRLPAIDELTATFTLKPGGRGVIIVQGELSAKVTQTCIVTLEPFDASVSEPIDLRFAPKTEEPMRRGKSSDEAETLTNAAADEPDPIVDGKIDLGAIASEFLTLGLDPYPRKPGVAFETPNMRADEPPASPFSALKASKKDN